MIGVVYSYTNKVNNKSYIGKTAKKIASLFNVSAGCIESIKNKRTWRHING